MEENMFNEKTFGEMSWVSRVVYTLIFQRKKHFMKKGSPLWIFYYI